MEYYFNELDPVKFQRLINSILLRISGNIRVLPVRGKDGGRDAETVIHDPFFEFVIEESNPRYNKNGDRLSLQKGRYLFQDKHHRTVDIPIEKAREAVIADFTQELKKNVLNRNEDERVNYFYLVTNVPGSKKSIEDIDKIREGLLKEANYLFADVWWKDQIVGFLDGMPSIWPSFPELFAGGKVPFLVKILLDGDNTQKNDLSKAIRLAIGNQFKRDSTIKFRIDDPSIVKPLSHLFEDLDVGVAQFSSKELQTVELKNFLQNSIHQPLVNSTVTLTNLPHDFVNSISMSRIINQNLTNPNDERQISIIKLLMNENNERSRRILIEGGPGQGKSTVSQMIAQIYRLQLLKLNDAAIENRWGVPAKIRLPFRLELKRYAEWLGQHSEGSIEDYLAFIFTKDAGGREISCSDIQDIIEKTPSILILDGLDEVGNEQLRAEVVTRIVECIDRFEKTLEADLRIVLTTRPPALSGYQDSFAEFNRVHILPMDAKRIKSYVNRWLTVQSTDKEESQTILESFDRRYREHHVKALAKNPMQLSILLHFLASVGEAFPDNRTELYKEYFRIVINREIDKSKLFKEHRATIEALHLYLGYTLHASTEAKKIDGALEYRQLIRIVTEWLKLCGNETIKAEDLFKVERERLCLIFALKGEGEETRYGYEVQPIREYFAAAYLNNEISGDSHDIFEALIHRPYWREVALFLAGLGKTNEKADLITRTRSIDEDTKLGWRQDGRTIILQLLQEGVFSQPPRVFSEALDFVLDLLDPDIIKIQNTPQDLIEVLPALIKQSGTKRHIDRLVRIVRANGACTDTLTLYRLFKILKQVLPINEFTDVLFSYNGRDMEVLSKVYVLWPLLWKVNFREAGISNPWQHISPERCAFEIWNSPDSTSYDDHQLFSIIPQQYFLHLYVADPLTYLFPLSKRRRTKSNLAVWSLIAYQKQFLNYSLNKKAIIPKSNTLIDYIGLEEPIVSFIKDIIHHLQQSLVQINKNDSEYLSLLAPYISLLKSHLQKPGLEGMIAFVCSFVLLLAICMNSIGVKGDFLLFRTENSEDLQKVLSLLSEQKELVDLWNQMRPYLGSHVSTLGIKLKTDEPVNKNDLHDFSILIGIMYLGGYPFSLRDHIAIISKYVRVTMNGKVFSTLDLIIDEVVRGKPLSFVWVNALFYQREDIVYLVKASKRGGRLPEMLIKLNILTIVETRFQRDQSKTLSKSEINAIIEIVQETNDTQILNGALIALSTSAYLESISKAALIKLLENSSPNSDYSTSIFESGYAHRNDISPNEKDTELIFDVATLIVNDPDTFAYKIRCAAASYLVERLPLNLPPLLEEQERLKIYF